MISKDLATMTARVAEAERSFPGCRGDREYCADLCDFRAPAAQRVANPMCWRRCQHIVETLQRSGYLRKRQAK